MKHTFLFSLFTLAAIPALNLQAAEKHVHGEAEIFIAIDGNTVLIDFESPADNIIGFEHAPKNEQQQNTLAASIDKLKNYKSLMTINGGQCTQIKNSVEAPFTEHHEEHEEHAHEKHNEHKHEEHGHEKHDKHEHKEHGNEKHDEHEHKEHGHEKHDDHEHKEHAHEKHDDHGEQEDSHSDFFASYTLECLSPKNIKNINIAAFELFSKLETVEVKWVNSESQGSQKTNTNKRVINF